MKNTIKDYKIGQIVGIVVVKNSNAYRSVKDYGKPRIFNAKITKIGKKYITAETEIKDYVFDIKNDFYEKTDVCANYQLFPSRKKAEEFVEMEEIEYEIRIFWGYYYGRTDFTLEELRSIKTIIENAKRRITNNE